MFRCRLFKTKKTETESRCGSLFLFVLCLLFSFMAGAGGNWGIEPVRAESLWDRRSRRNGFICSDHLASEIGDLLTVVVSDSSSFHHEGERDMEKSSSHKAKASASTAGEALFKTLDLSENSSRTFEGSNEYTGSREFNDVMSVTVVDKLPNGNLVVGGKKERKVAGERVTTILTGVVRPEDVTVENSILLQNIGKTRIFYDSKGTSSGFLKLGWFNRIINILWPL